MWRALKLTCTVEDSIVLIESARREANRNLVSGLTGTEPRRPPRALHACLERLWLVDRSGGVGHAPAPPPSRRHA